MDGVILLTAGVIQTIIGIILFTAIQTSVGIIHITAGITHITAGTTLIVVGDTLATSTAAATTPIIQAEEALPILITQIPTELQELIPEIKSARTGEPIIPILEGIRLTEEQARRLTEEAKRRHKTTPLPTSLPVQEWTQTDLGTRTIPQQELTIQIQIVPETTTTPHQDQTILAVAAEPPAAAVEEAECKRRCTTDCTFYSNLNNEIKR